MSATITVFGSRFPATRPRRSATISREKLAILAVAVVTIGLVAVKPAWVHYQFPAMAVLVGVYLFRCNPVLYVSYTLWLYFLSPFVRRVVDFRSSWMNPNPILLAPLLVTLLNLGFLVKQINRTWFRRETLPFVLALAAVGLGFLSGLFVNDERSDLFAAALNWLAPISFGFYLTRFPFDRDRLKIAVVKTFVAGVLVMGTYGIYQFVRAPEWDCNWLDGMTDGNIEVSVMGRPEPFGLRVWSTMNSPGPFSTALTAGLLLLFVYSGRLRISAALAGYMSFLLSLVRSGWLGWAAGLAAILFSSRKHLLRVLAVSAAGLILCLPLLLYEPFAEAVQNRFQTFQSIGNDESANERADEYIHLSDDILRNPLGFGLTTKDRLNGYVLDSTLLRMPLQLGWLGCLLYAAAIALLVRNLFPLPRVLSFGVVARAIAISVLVRAPFGQVLVSIDGVVLWMFIALALCEVRRHKEFEPLPFPLLAGQTL